MNQKFRKSVVAASIFAVIALPATVYASLLPMEGGTMLEKVPILGETMDKKIPIETGAMDEKIPIDLDSAINGKTPIEAGTFGELKTIGQNGSLTSSEALLQVPPIISTSKEIFTSINTGNIDGAINRILGILGQLGLIDPAHESQSASTDPDNPYSNPQTPEQVYQLQRHVDLIRSENPQKLSQIVFGPQGQAVLSQQAKAVESAQIASVTGQRGVAATYQQSVATAQRNASSAENVKAQNLRARSANVTQDVMKALAAQNEDLAQIGAGNSAQLAYLGKAASYQSAQLSAANSQLGAINDKTQTLEVLSASQNYQAAQINAAIDRQSHYEQTLDSVQQNAAYQSSNLLYIPGLVTRTDAQGGVQ